MNSNEEKVASDEPGFGRGGRGRHRLDGHGRFGGRGKRMWMFLPLFAIFILAKAAVVMALWNVLVPDVFHFSEITYLQALELTVLAKLLVGGMGGFRGGFGGGRHFGRGHHHWKERWASLSPDEREKYREELKKRFD